MMQSLHRPHQMQTQLHLHQPQTNRLHRLMGMETTQHCCRQRNLVPMSLLNRLLKSRYYQRHHLSRQKHQFLLMFRLSHHIRRQRPLLLS